VSTCPILGGIAQLVERLVRNEKARGSNPLTSTSFIMNDLGIAELLPKNNTKNASANVLVFLASSGKLLRMAGQANLLASLGDLWDFDQGIVFLVGRRPHAPRRETGFTGAD
jgi:hypothetical protein